MDEVYVTGHPERVLYLAHMARITQNPEAHMIARKPNFMTQSKPSAKQLLTQASRAKADWKKKIEQVDSVGLSLLKEGFLCLISWKPFCHRQIIWM